MTTRYRAVICDIDGCLAPESSAPFNAHLLARLAEHNHRAQAAPHDGFPVVTVCSGRPQPFAEAICRLIANHTLPAIAENGVWVWHPATNRYDMDPDITPDHLAAVDAARRWVTRDLAPRGVVMQPGKAASISLYHDEPRVLRELEPAVRDRFAREHWPLRVSMTWFYINCDLAHISKGTAIARWKEHTGLTREALAGIGDTPSDAAIADHVAFFACPANAHDAIKPRAAYISAQGEIAGVLDILQQLH